MPNAVLTQTIITATLTQAKMVAGLATALTNAGFTAYPSYNISSSIGQTFYCTYNNNPKGTVYLNIVVTPSGNITSTIYDSWNNTTNTGTNASLGANTTTNYLSNSSNQMVLTAVSHPEFKGVIIVQPSATNGIIGVLRPSNVPIWWNENIWLYAFLASAQTSMFNSWLPPGLNPFNTANANYPLSFMSSPAFANANPNNSNNLDLIAGLVLCQPSGGGYISGSAGTTSTDVCLGAANNKNLFDVWTYSSTRYTLLSNGGIPGFGIKTAG